jgi:hypothetical protein
VGGAVNAALNGGNPFLAGLIGGATAGLLGGMGFPGLDGSLTPALLGTHLGVAATNLAPGNDAVDCGCANNNSLLSLVAAPVSSFKTCVGIGLFTAVGPGQARGPGALANFGVPGHQPGKVAISPAAFGLPFPEPAPGQRLSDAQRAQREQAQRALAMVADQISISALGLRLEGGPASPYTVSDIGDIRVRSSPIVQFDIYGFPSQRAALRFGRQFAETIITMPAFLSCPPGTQEAR